jgi:hypothetical protein
MAGHSGPGCYKSETSRERQRVVPEEDRSLTLAARLLLRLANRLPICYNDQSTRNPPLESRGRPLLHRGAPLSASKLAMLLVYGGTLLLSAILVFFVEIILGKMITPLMGGTPEVWNTCMVFFQAMLLAGYAYAHWTTTTLGPRKQATLHLCLMVLPLLFLFPLAVNKDLIPISTTNPIGTVLLVLLAAVGIPFFIVSASAPMLQKWFSSTDHPSAPDPYFLYGASNLGSMLLLFFYPVIIEPSIGIRAQSWIWSIGYVVLFALTALCAVMMWNSPPPAPVPEPTEENPEDENHPLSGKVTWGRRLRWIALALVPSSLLLGATSYMTVDVAPIPLLWVLPLALYLGTFIIVFSKTPKRIQDWLVGFFEPIFPGHEKTLRAVLDGHKVLILLLPLLILLLVFLMMSDVRQNTVGWLFGLLILHMVTLFVVAMVCHGELARDRPSAKYLTEFFMWMSFGGVVGGLINSLAAPVLFDGNYEYPLVMVLACLLLPHLSNEEESKWGFTLDTALAGLFVLVGGLLIVLRLVDNNLYFNRMSFDKFKWFIVALAGLTIFGGWYLMSKPKERATRVMDLILPVCLALLTVGLIWAMQSRFLQERVLEFTDSTGRTYVQSRLARVTSWANTVIGWIGAPFNAQWAMGSRQFGTILAFGLPAILCYTFVERSVRFGLGVAAILLAGGFCAQLASSDKFQERGFFGVLKVEQGAENLTDEDYPDVVVHRLVHGTTLHGKQIQFGRRLTADGRVVRFDTMLTDEPLTYYHRTGPIGQVCEAYCPNPVGLGLAAGPFAGAYAYNFPECTNKIGVIGLGTGTMSCYARPGQTIVFYDIDPLVKRISFDERKRDAEGNLLPGEEQEYFSYVKDARARGANVELRLNDARLAIEREVAALEKDAREAAQKSGKSYEEEYARLRNERGYKVLVVDAFSSDAIPIHLITLEALKLYLKFMRDDGIVCFHISNRYLDLQPVLANLVEEIRKTDPAEKNLTGYYENDKEYGILGKASSTWVMIARSERDTATLEKEAREAAQKSGKPVEEEFARLRDYYALSKLETVDRWKGHKKELSSQLERAAGLPMWAGSGMSGPAVCLALNGFLTGEFRYKDPDEPTKVYSAYNRADPPWKPIEPTPSVGVWTDDYAPILKAFNLFR